MEIPDRVLRPRRTIQNRTASTTGGKRISMFENERPERSGLFCCFKS
jgi:hypothetical protein